MNPSDKAEELINRFNPMTYTAVHANKTPYEKSDAIKCAMIAVDEIKRALLNESKVYPSYWEEVRLQLNKYFEGQMK